MPTCAVDGIELYYRDQGSGVPLLLLHAFPLSGEMFAPQLAALTQRWRLIVPDQRGFGRSGVTPWPTEMQRLAEDGLALLDHLGIERAVIGGVSMGGYASMALLARAPERVRGLVLIDTQAAADDDPARARREALAAETMARGMGVLAEAFLPRLLPESAPPELKAAARALIEANPPAGSAAALRGLALRPDHLATLASYLGPALVVVGELDQVTPPARAEEMVRALAGAELVTVPGAGHLSSWEAPERVNAALERFLARLT